MLVCRVLGIGNVINWRPVKDHLFARRGIAIKTANAVVKLNPVVQSRGGIAKKNLIGTSQAKNSIWLLLAHVVAIKLNPIIYNRGLPEENGVQK